MREEEIWKEVPGYDGEYLVSSHGNVKTVKRGEEILLRQYLKGARKDNMYYAVYLYKRGQKRKCFKVHRLVAMCFIHETDASKPFVNHKDLNKLNNNHNNLEWVSVSENNLHSWKSGFRFATEKMRETARLYARINFGLL